METTYHCYANRELSWLRFNERVLEEAEDSRLPLCERLSFLSIFQSNLDEFFMVRIGSLQDQMLLDKSARENKTKMTSGEQIEAAMEQIHKLTSRRDAVYNALLEHLAEQGIRLLDFAHMEPDSRAELEKLFQQDYLPLLSSFIVSKKQAFPFLKNKGIYAVAVLNTKAEKKKIGIVPCGGDVFPRLVPVPGRTGCFILSEELILHFLPLLYRGYKVSSKTLARITRNADIDADLIYDEDLNYRDHMAEVVKKRKKLAPVRLELSRAIDVEVIQSLCKSLKLDEKRVFAYESPLDHSFLFQLQDKLRSHTDLFFAPRHPQASPAFDERKPLIPQIEQEDKLLHYPYESIRPFLQLLNEAASDPDVVSIKMTLYRLANHSKVVDALVEAAENGKQVDVLVELKARFDEENNIEWSRLLERAGCHVVYGIEELKVHSKLCLITRKTDEGVSFITQIGTGNYNEKTSRLYTDLSFLTVSKEIGLEATEVFRALDQGVPGETENIRILSIVGRYLEHSRIYIFGRGERARYYIGSADWMTRSTLRRVEIAAPVTAPALTERLQHIFDTMLAGNYNARVQQPDGSYVPRMPFFVQGIRGLFVSAQSACRNRNGMIRWRKTGRQVRAMYKNHSSPAAIETQEKLRCSLLKELKHKTLAQVKISELCKTAGVSRNAFYRNFETLEDVLVYHLDTVGVEMVEALSGLPREDYLETYMAAFFRFWYGHRETLDLFFRNNISNLLILRLSELVEFTMEDSVRTPASPNPIKGYVFFSGGMVSVLYAWIRNGYELSPDDLAKWTMDNVRRGLQN